MAEMIGYHADGRQSAYTANRSGSGAWNETRSYGYTLGRGWLQNETYAPASGQSATVSNVYDFGGSWIGMLTSRTQGGSGAGVLMHMTFIDYFWRVDQMSLPQERTNVALSGLAKGAVEVRAFVDGEEVNHIVHPGPYDAVGAWSGTAALTPGAHQLRVQGIMPTGKTAEAVSQFTVNATAQTRDWIYDEAGNVVAIQKQSTVYPYDAFLYDAQGRTDYYNRREASGQGRDERYIYDGLGRRIRTHGWTIQNYMWQSRIEEYFYDPLVEFLEIGVALNGQRTWKVHGPDLNGRYGGLHGIGGVEAWIEEGGGTGATVFFWRGFKFMQRIE